METVFRNENGNVEKRNLPGMQKIVGVAEIKKCNCRNPKK